MSAGTPVSATLLAFDTSTEAMAIAVAGPHGMRTIVEPGGARASARLLPRIHALLAEAGVALGELDAIAFGRGPGAFTGLRTSCAVAQGLGFGLGRPVVGVDSLLVVAEDARAQASPGGVFDVTVAMDARMDEAYAGRYRFDGHRWAVVEPPALTPLPALPRLWSPAPQAIAGSALAAFGDRLPAAPSIPRIASERDRAAALLRIAQAEWAAGRAGPAAEALPLYLRDKVALTTRERDAHREASR